MACSHDVRVEFSELELVTMHANVADNAEVDFLKFNRVANVEPLNSCQPSR